MKTPPIRTCIITREKKPQHELLRLVVESHESKRFVCFDFINAKPGRGCYIIPQHEVLEKALQIGAIERALRLDRKLTTEEKTVLMQKFETRFK